MDKSKVAILSGAIGVLLIGILTGAVYATGWGLTTIAIMIVFALIAIVYAFTVMQDVHDGQPMPEAQRRFLALYLICLCVPLVYVTFALFGVQFHDVQAATRPGAVPTIAESGRPPDGRPLIVRVIPNAVAVDSGPVDLQIFGYNLNGAPGPTGTSGATGGAARGATGTQGSGGGRGSAGATGTSGSSGAAGASGSSGAAGASGSSGATGASGSAGATGPSGASGATGAGGGRPAAPAGPTVTVNDQPKSPKMASDQILIVPLDTADSENAGSVEVRVTTANGFTTSTLRIVDQTGTLKILGRSHEITREMQLLLLVIFAGALGSYVHALRSLTAYIGNQQAVASWFWFYVTRPFVGVALAIVFYAAIRGGFVAGSPADAKAVNPFGVFAIAGLVGMFADKAGNKLAEIFDALFKSTDPATQRKNPLSSLTITTPSLPPAVAGKDYKETKAKIDADGGKGPIKFTLTPPGWLQIDPSSGDLSGTPPATDAGKTIKVTVTAFDQTTTSTQSKTFDVVIG